MNTYVLEDLRACYSHKLANLANVLWGLEQYGYLQYTSNGQEICTNLDIEAMLSNA